MASLALGAALTAAAGVAHAACHREPLTESPVGIQGMRAFVTGQVNGTDERFLISSGQAFSLLSKQVATQLQVPLGAPNGIAFAHGTVRRFQVARVKDFTIFGGTLHDLQFVSRETAEGGPAGIIGQNFLRIIGDAEYDFAHQALRFWHTSGCSRDEMAYWVKGGDSYSMVDIESTTERHPIAMATAYLNGTPIHVVLVTGTPVSVLSLRAAARAGVKPGDPDVKTAGGDTWIAPFASFKIGEEEIRNTHLRIGDLGYEHMPLRYGNVRIPLSDIDFGDEIDLLLGFDFFLSHRVLVSDAHHQVFFSYNGGPIFDLTGQTAAAAAAPAESK